MHGIIYSHKCFDFTVAQEGTVFFHVISRKQFDFVNNKNRNKNGELVFVFYHILLNSIGLRDFRQAIGMIDKINDGPVRSDIVSFKNASDLYFRRNNIAFLVHVNYIGIQINHSKIQHPLRRPLNGSSRKKKKRSSYCDFVFLFLCGW